MKASTLNLHSIANKTKIISSNKQMIILLGLFFAGLIIGSFSVKNENSFIVSKTISSYMSYVKSKAEISNIAVFFSTMLMSSSVIVIAYFIGLCAIGIPLISLIPLATGSFIGMISGYIYETYMLKGLGYCGIIIFPCAVISVSAIIFSCKESMLMSKNMLNLLSQRHNNKYNDFKTYSLKFVIYISISASGALIEAIMNHLFIRLFNF